MTAPESAGAAGAWHAQTGEQVAGAFGVDPATGLTAAEVETRRAKYGPNKFAESAQEPRWHALLRQYRDPMQIVLLVAGIGSIYPVKEYGTGVVLILLTVLNAVLGLNQEGKAAAAVAALQKMMIIKAKVLRDGRLEQMPADQLVPGDIVLGRGGRHHPGRRPAAPGGDARGRRVGADRRERAGLEGHRRGRGRGRPARRPQRHGLHEHERDARHGHVRRDVDRDGDRGGAHLRDAPVGGRQRDAADAAARRADAPDPDHRRRRGRDLDGAEPVARRQLRHRLHRGDRLRRLRDPDRAAGGRDDDPLARHADPREGERDREAAPLDRDARLDVRDQLGQDGDADAEPDDGDRDGDPGPAVPIDGSGYSTEGKSSASRATRTCRSTSS